MELRIEKQNVPETKYVIHLDHTKSGYGLLGGRKGREDISMKESHQKEA
jgi:hypothetical protein